MGHKKPVRIEPLAEALPPGGVDSHAHLDSEEFNGNRDEVITLANKVGVTQIGNVFLSPQAYNTRKSWFEGRKDIFFLLGIHPHDGLSCEPECLAAMEKIFQADERVRACGEIGLDYHYDHCPRDRQMDVFAMQLELARKLNKPVVIHCREAEDDCLTLLEGGGFQNYPLLWHCFGGDTALAKRIIRNGWHVSIPGTVTYLANGQLREAVQHIPADRLLLETDCPYLAPNPWRGTINQPANLVFTARCVAVARNESPEVLWQQCGENARNFFGINSSL